MDTANNLENLPGSPRSEYNIILRPELLEEEKKSVLEHHKFVIITVQFNTMYKGEKLRIERYWRKERQKQ